jgi:hypothetical protein
MFDANDLLECPPEMLGMLKNLAAGCIPPHEVVNKFVSESSPDAATRNLATAALVIALAQVAGPAAIRRPPGCLLVHAGGLGSDPLDCVTGKLTGISNAAPTVPPNERVRLKNWMVKQAMEVIAMSKTGNLACDFLYLRATEFKQARCEAFGGDRAGLYASRCDVQIGWVADGSNHVVLRLDRDEDRLKFREDVVKGDPLLLNPYGLGDSMVMAPKVLSVAGSVTADLWDAPLVEGIVDRALPILFLPHYANAFLKTAGELAMQKVAIDLENAMHRGLIHSPVVVPGPLPSLPWFTACHARLRQRLLHFPERYDFYIQGTLRDLIDWCRRLSHWLLKPDSAANERNVLYSNLARATFYAVFHGVEGLGWHGYGFAHAPECSREEFMKLLNAVRKAGTLSRRDVLLKLQWLRAEKRDRMLEHLAAEGLITLTDSQVEAVPLAEYIKAIPTRSGIQPPALAATTTVEPKPAAKVAAKKQARAKKKP